MRNFCVNFAKKTAKQKKIDITKTIATSSNLNIIKNNNDGNNVKNCIRKYFWHMWIHSPGLTHNL